jgi:hypothetical protein
MSSSMYRYLWLRWTRIKAGLSHLGSSGIRIRNTAYISTYLWFGWTRIKACLSQLGSAGIRIRKNDQQCVPVVWVDPDQSRPLSSRQRRDPDPKESLAVRTCGLGGPGSRPVEHLLNTCCGLDSSARPGAFWRHPPLSCLARPCSYLAFRFPAAHRSL